MLLSITCFNPCFNGTYSLTAKLCYSPVGVSECFNPCFNGTYSLTKKDITLWYDEMQF